MESILSDGTLEFDDDGGGFSGDPGRVFPTRIRLPCGVPQVGDSAGDNGPRALRLPWPEPRTPPEPLDPLGPDRPLAPGPLPWPHEPDWKSPVYIRFELGGHPPWPGWWQDGGIAADR
jgi:hypothetical protein